MENAGNLAIAFRHEKSQADRGFSALGRLHSLHARRRCRRRRRRCESQEDSHPRRPQGIPLQPRTSSPASPGRPQGHPQRSPRLHHPPIRRLRRLPIHLPRNQPLGRHPQRRRNLRRSPLPRSRGQTRPNGRFRMRVQVGYRPRSRGVGFDARQEGG